MRIGANLLDLRSRKCSLGHAMAEIEDEDEYLAGRKSNKLALMGSGGGSPYRRQRRTNYLPFQRQDTSEQKRGPICASLLVRKI
jgi:hypothetical protein